MHAILGASAWQTRPPRTIYNDNGAGKERKNMSSTKNEKSVNVVAVSEAEAIQQACTVMQAYESLSRDEQQAVLSSPELWGEFEMFVKAGIDAIPALDKQEAETRAASLRGKLFKQSAPDSVRGRLEQAVASGQYHAEKRMSGSERAFYQALLQTDKQELADAHAKNKTGPHADALMSKVTQGKRSGLSGAKPHLRKLVGASLRDMYAKLAE